MIRFAIDADGPAIGKLFRDADVADLGVDWSAGVAGWLVAVAEDGTMLGAIQAVPGKPFGFIGDVVVAPAWQGRRADGQGSLHKRPGAVGFALFVLALDYLKQMGSQVVVGVTDQPGLQRMLERFGAVALGPHTLLARDLTRWPRRSA